MHTDCWNINIVCLKKIKAAMTLSKRNFVSHLEHLLCHVLSHNIAPQIYIGLLKAQTLSLEIWHTVRYSKYHVVIFVKSPISLNHQNRLMRKTCYLKTKQPVHKTEFRAPLLAFNTPLTVVLSSDFFKKCVNSFLRSLEMYNLNWWVTCYPYTCLCFYS